MEIPINVLFLLLLLLFTFSLRNFPFTRKKKKENGKIVDEKSPANERNFICAD